MAVKIFISLFLVGVIIYYAGATDVMKCHDSEKIIKDLTERVTIGTCKKPPCRLRRNTAVTFAMKITPDRDLEKVVNSIYGFIAGVPFPAPGYDQTDACRNMYSSDGKKQVGCPLKKGQDYLYKNVLDVLPIYPRIKAVVHWGVVDGDGKEVMCFQVPLRVTN